MTSNPLGIPKLFFGPTGLYQFFNGLMTALIYFGLRIPMFDQAFLTVPIFHPYTKLNFVYHGQQSLVFSGQGFAVQRHRWNGTFASGQVDPPF
jgi:hypothetical protein